MSRKTIEGLLEAHGRAVTEGDVLAIARNWEVPSLIIGDGGVTLLSTQNDVVAFFVTELERYREKGMLSMLPQITNLEALTDAILVADVDWVGLDASGAQAFVEVARYVFHVRGGRPHVHVGMMLGIR